MDLEIVRLLTGQIEGDESTVSLVISEIAGALAMQPALDLAAFEAEIRHRADRQPEARPCLEKLLEDLRVHRASGSDRRRSDQD